jgi:hypothetical protein
MKWVYLIGGTPGYLRDLGNSLAELTTIEP